MKNIIIPGTICCVLLLDSFLYARVINVPQDCETIQGAIFDARHSDTVLVHPGIYRENIDFRGRLIIVASLFLTTDDESYIDFTIIDGQDNGTVVVFDSGESPSSKLIGFTIRGGYNRMGGGIFCLDSSPTLSHLLVTGNRSSLWGGGVCLYNSAALLTNVRIVDNSSELDCGGININHDSHVLLRNCEISGNSAHRDCGGLYCGAHSHTTLEYVSIVDNDAGEIGGGVHCHDDVDLDIRNITLAGNTAQIAPGFWVVGGNNDLYFLNSILWQLNSPQITIDTEGQRGNLVAVEYSDIREGQNGIVVEGNANISWQQGNIDGDPLFIDSEHGDYHIVLNSPCVDTGNPRTELDPDGSRADMGAFPCFQGASLYGFVYDLADNSPLPDVRIISSRRNRILTDENGYWFMSGILVSDDQFNLTASKAGYNDSTVTDLRLQVDDTLEVTFRLRHPEFTPSVDEIHAELYAGDTTSVDLLIRNTGNGPLQWDLADNAIPDTQWTLLESYAVTRVLNDYRLKGVAFVNDRFYVAGGNWGNPMIYMLDQDCHYIDRFRQFGITNQGTYDLTWDGELIWGADGTEVFGFTPQGDLQLRFGTNVSPIRAITWDSQREILWITGRGDNEIKGYDRRGNEVATLPAPNFIIYGLAFFNDDCDEYPIYIIHGVYNELEHELYKMNNFSGDILPVVSILPHQNGTPRGAFITDQMDPDGEWMIMTVTGIAQARDGDRLDIWRFSSSATWTVTGQTEGTLNAGVSHNMTITFFAGSYQEEYNDELVFTHNAFGSPTRIPVNLTVHPSAVGELDDNEKPTRFEIISVAPNPFNAVTTIEYALPEESNVTITLSDITGRELYDMHLGSYEPGSHSIQVDLNKYPTGMYLVRLTAGNNIAVRKIVYIE